MYDSKLQFTAIVWYREEASTKHRSYVVVSDCMEHSKSAVVAFNRAILADLRENIQFEHIHYWTDGAASQFKSKYMMHNLLFHESDFGITADWSYFATSHGKGPVDGIGGTVKRNVYLEVLKGGIVVNGYEDFLHAARKLNRTINILDCDSSVVENVEAELSRRYAGAPDMPGIRSKHFFRVVDGNVVSQVNTKYLQQGIQEVEHELMEGEPAASSSYIDTPTSPIQATVGCVIAVAFDDTWHIGEIMGHKDEDNWMVKFMAKSGYVWRWTQETSLVHKKFGLRTSPILVPSKSLRTFTLENQEEIELEYSKYQEKWF